MLTASDIAITPTGRGTLYLAAPHHPLAEADYERLNGLWKQDSRVWVFPETAEDGLRRVLRARFGHDDRPYTTITISYRLGAHNRKQDSLIVAGQTIGRRYAPLLPVELAPRATVTAGAFASKVSTSGTPSIGPVQGIVVTVEGVPLRAPELLDEADHFTIPDVHERDAWNIVRLERRMADLCAELGQVSDELEQARSRHQDGTQ